MTGRNHCTDGKKTWGRKRHLLIDTQGYLLAIKVLAASSSDAEGARALLEPLKERLPRPRDAQRDGTLQENTAIIRLCKPYSSHKSLNTLPRSSK